MTTIVGRHFVYKIVAMIIDKGQTHVWFVLEIIVRVTLLQTNITTLGYIS